MVVALSATALPEDRPAIMELLSMREAKTFEVSLYHSNLTFSKHTVSSRKAQQMELKCSLKKHHKHTTIVFCNTKFAVENVAKYLETLYPDEVMAYHSGKKQQEKAMQSGEEHIIVAMKKWAGKGTIDCGNWAIIKALGKNIEKILNWYLKRLQPATENYLRYQNAVDIVSQVKGKKTRERMLFLLRKTSDSVTLTAALEKLRKECNLNKNQCRNVLKKFEKFGVSPITLPNTSKCDELPTLF